MKNKTLTYVNPSFFFYSFCLLILYGFFVSTNNNNILPLLISQMSFVFAYYYYEFELLPETYNRRFFLYLLFAALAFYGIIIQINPSFVFYSLACFVSEFLRRSLKNKWARLFVLLSISTFIYFHSLYIFFYHVLFFIFVLLMDFASVSLKRVGSRVFAICLWVFLYAVIIFAFSIVYQTPIVYIALFSPLLLLFKIDIKIPILPLSSFTTLVYLFLLIDVVKLSFFTF